MAQKRRAGGAVGGKQRSPRKKSTTRGGRVGVGLVGLGFMGLTHLRALRAVRGGRLVALTTSDPRKAKGDFRGVGGNFGSGGAREDLSGIDVYANLDAMLDDPKVDLVDICLPSYLHARVAKQCLAAGKHVLVEKPIALEEKDGLSMMEASKSARRLLMVAQVLKFFPEFDLLANATRDERYGKLRALHMRRLIARPSWSDDSWFGDAKKSGGMGIDLHIHDTDFIAWLFGKPKAVLSGGIADREGLHFVRTTYEYARSKPLVSAEGGWINAPGLPFEHGYDAFFESGTLFFNSSVSPAPKLYTGAGKKPRELKLRAKDGFEVEMQAAVDSVRAGRVDPRLSPKSATMSLAICSAEEASVKSKRRVEIA